MASLGKYRVGATFNPSASPAVTAIKAAASTCIDVMIEQVNKASPAGVTTDLDQERYDLLTLATRAVEEGAMWAVKAVTKEANAE